MAHRRRILISLACGLALLAVTAGCGGGEEQPAPTPRNATPAAGAVEIADFKFAPAAITVDAGTEVTWTNGDSAPHTATAGDGSFDTGTLDKDTEGKVTLDEPGTYAYVCEFHPFMNGTIQVN